MSDDDYDDDVEDDDDIEDDDGIQEAHAGGKALKDAGYKFDVAHTSVLQVTFDHGDAFEVHDDNDDGDVPCALCPLFPPKQARNLRRCALKAGKTSTPKTENLAHLTYLHAESGMRNKSKLGHL